MSAISSIANAAQSAVSAASSPTSGAVPGAGARNPYAEVSSEEWLGIILEELSNQDPFEPNDTSATLEQLNSLRSIESDINLSEQLESLVLQNSIGQAGSLIGRQVDGLSTDGFNITGVVESVRVIDGKTQLQLDGGQSVDFGNITNVSNAPAPAPGINSGATLPATADAGNNAAIAQALAGLANPTLTAAERDAVQDEETAL